jgi:hypothetical protein
MTLSAEESMPLKSRSWRTFPPRDWTGEPGSVGDICSRIPFMISPSPVSDPAVEEFLRQIAPVRNRIEQLILFGSREDSGTSTTMDYFRNSTWTNSPAATLGHVHSCDGVRSHSPLDN